MSREVELSSTKHSTGTGWNKGESSLFQENNCIKSWLWYRREIQMALVERMGGTLILRDYRGTLS